MQKFFKLNRKEIEKEVWLNGLKKNTDKMEN